MKRNSLNTKINYYTFALLKYWVNELIIRFSDELVLVYTMAKVGSTSFYSIYKKGIFSPVFHFHSLNIEKQALNKLELSRKGFYPDSRSNAKSILQHIQRKKKHK